MHFVRHHVIFSEGGIFAYLGAEGGFSVSKVLHLIMVDQVDRSPYQGHEILQESEQYSF